MDLGIQGKVALVTAASKGLGRGSATALSAEGCRLAIFALSLAVVEQAAADISAQTGIEVGGFTADMSAAGDSDRL